MALRLGRAGLDIPLREPQVWNQAGSEVELGGLLTDLSSWELRAQREQLLALTNPDEPAILVRSDSVPELDGFYRVDKVEVAAPPGSFAYRSLPWGATLSRLSGWQQPFIETYMMSLPIPHGWATAPPTAFAYHFFPSTATSHAHTQPSGIRNGWGGSSAPIRPTENGDLTYANTNVEASGGGPINGTVIWTVPLADYYRADCRIEYDHLNDGTGWRRVLGRQVLNKPTQIRLNNGVVRLTLGSAGTFVPAWFLNPGWGSSKTWRFTVGANATVSGMASWAQVSILRNTPEECSIRLVADPIQSSRHTYIADVTIKRGSRWVFVRLFAIGASQEITIMPSWIMESVVTPEAATALVPGIHRSANDASGNRWLLASDYGTTTDLTNSKLTTGVRIGALFGFGLELGGTASVSPNTASEQFGEWYAGYNSAQRPVGM